MGSQTRRAERPLQLTPKASKLKAKLCYTTYGLAILGCVLNNLALPIKLALLSAVALHIVRNGTYRKCGLHSISHSESSGWQINGQAATILPSTTISRFVIFLHYEELKDKAPKMNHKHAEALFFDALDKDDFRHLLTRLKIYWLSNKECP